MTDNTIISQIREPDGAGGQGPLRPRDGVSVRYRIDYLEDGQTIVIIAAEHCTHRGRCKCDLRQHVLAEGLTLADVLDIYVGMTDTFINDVVRRLAGADH